MAKNKWAEFESESYEIIDLGRPAVFLVPVSLMNLTVDMGVSVAEQIELFLAAHFGGSFTKTLVPSFGVWRDGRNVYHQDECAQYEVSFVGKDKIPLLVGLLVRICRWTGEQCIYFKAGQYACLVRPRGGWPLVVLRSHNLGPFCLDNFMIKLIICLETWL